MNKWIECNLPWYVRLEMPEGPPFPDMNSKVKGHFGKDTAHFEEDFFPGYHTDGMGFLSEHPIFQEYEDIRDNLINDHLERDYTEEQVKDILSKSEKQSVKTVLAYRAKMREINDWIESQPEVIAFCQSSDAIHKDHKEQEGKLSFCGHSLNRAGTVIEFEEEGKICQMMIGTINELGGSCDDCRGISDETIILRYKILWNGKVN